MNQEQNEKIQGYTILSKREVLKMLAQFDEDSPLQETRVFESELVFGYKSKHNGAEQILIKTWNIEGDKK